MDFFFKKKTPPSPTITPPQPTVQPTPTPTPPPINLFQSLNVKSNKLPAVVANTNINTSTNIIPNENIQTDNKEGTITNISKTQPENILVKNDLENIIVEEKKQDIVALEEEKQVENKIPEIPLVKDNDIVEENQKVEINSNKEVENIEEKEEINNNKSEIEKNINGLSLVKDELEKKIIGIKVFFEELSVKKIDLNRLLGKNLLEIKQLQDEQSVAVENENYDLASSIEQKMIDLSKENESNLESFFKLMSGGYINDFSSEEIMLKYHQETQGILDFLNENKGYLDSEFKKYKESIQEQLEQKKYDAQSRQDQIEREAKHLKLDKEILESDEKSLHEKIQSESKPLFLERETIQLKKIEIQNEIDELLKQIEKKKQEQLQLDRQMDDLDGRVQLVRNKFQQEEKRISIENLNIQDRVIKIEEMRSEANKMVDELDQLSNPVENSDFIQLRSIDQCIEQHDSFILNSESILEESERLSREVYREIYDKMSLHFNLVSKLIEKSNTTQQSITTISLQLQQENKLKLELKNSITIIEDHIPQLEQSKNQAKDSKKFTEAANLLNEIKQQQQSLTEKKKQLEQLNDQISLNSNNLSTLESELNKLKENIDLENQNIYSLFTII